MRILYLDDSGKPHPNHPSRVVAFAGISVDESQWHDLVRQITGAKGKYFPKRGKPVEWELKTKDFLTPNAWKRANNRRFCNEVAEILRKNNCHVYAVYFEKAASKGPLKEDWAVPLSFQRLAEKFECELRAANTRGSIVCDWSTHALDRHVSNCVQSHIITQGMHAIIGGVTYGSSQSLVPIQVSDLVAATFRITEEGGSHLAPLRAAFEAIQSNPVGVRDFNGFSARAVSKLF